MVHIVLALVRFRVCSPNPPASIPAAATETATATVTVTETATATTTENGGGATFIDGEAAEASHASLKSLPSLEDSEIYDSDDGAGNQSQPSSKRPQDCLDGDDGDFVM